MANRNGNIVSEYHFLKNKIKKLIKKAEQIGPVQQPRVIKKIANLMQRLVIIEEDCKSMGIPHPDAFITKDEPTLSQIKEELFTKPQLRSLTNPDGTLYSKYSFYQQEGLQNLSKMMVKSNPDGSLFETPALEGAVLPRRNKTD